MAKLKHKMHFLITTGGTREYIDPVRFISNASSGRMGYAIAQAVLRQGHKVTLITTVKEQQLEDKDSDLKVVPVETTGEMFAAVKKFFSKVNCLIMTAAVCDYTPIKASRSKIKKNNKALIIKLKPTVDILKWTGEHKKQGQIVVGFALEDKNLRKNAGKKLRGKNLDMIIANRPAAIGAQFSEIEIKSLNSNWLKIPKTDKKALAEKIVQQIYKLL